MIIRWASKSITRSLLVMVDEQPYSPCFCLPQILGKKRKGLTVCALLLFLPHLHSAEQQHSKIGKDNPKGRTKRVFLDWELFQHYCKLPVPCVFPITIDPILEWNLFLPNKISILLKFQQYECKINIPNPLYSRYRALYREEKGKTEFHWMNVDKTIQKSVSEV